MGIQEVGCPCFGLVSSWSDTEWGEESCGLLLLFFILPGFRNSKRQFCYREIRKIQVGKSWEFGFYINILCYFFLFSDSLFCVIWNVMDFLADFYRLPESIQQGVIRYTSETKCTKESYHLDSLNATLHVAEEALNDLMERKISYVERILDRARYSF